MPLSIVPCWRRSSIWLTISSLPWRLPSRRISRKLPILRISPARQACRLRSTTLLRCSCLRPWSALAGLTTGGISFGRDDGVHLIAAGVQCPAASRGRKRGGDRSSWSGHGSCRIKWWTHLLMCLYRRRGCWPCHGTPTGSRRSGGHLD